LVTTSIMISWLDGDGTHWTRTDNGEPFISSAVVPHRDVEAYLEHPSRWQRAWRPVRKRTRALLHRGA
jgi:hypothetical protein